MSRFEQIDHGRYLIRTGPMAGGWAAQAFLGKKQVGDRQVGSSKEEVIEKTSQMLDEREARIVSGRGADGSPSADEYAEAFARLGKLPPSYEAMLDAHLAAPDNRITATQLANAAGYENFNGANLHYGKLGLMLAEELNFNPPRRADGTVIWTATLATWLDAAEPSAESQSHDEHFIWIMRPQVVEALQARS